MSMLDHALRYHDEGLCVIPIKPRDKAVALPTWEEYQGRISTAEEIRRWWGGNPNYNVGAVHGLNGYISIDIDHNTGIFEKLTADLPQYTAGRIEQSGSGKGYHIPLFIDEFPQLGYDSSKQRPKGNKTWATRQGDVNIRARYCQTVIPPSIHPTGGLYKFLNEKSITRLHDVNELVSWLNIQAPQAAAVTPQRNRPPVSNPNDALAHLKDQFPFLVETFASVGITGEVERVGDELRIKGHGGLFVNELTRRWYNFRDEMGGDVIDAFGWAKYGASWDRYNRQQFAEIMRDMKDRAGIGTVRDLGATPATKPTRAFKLAQGYWR